MTDLPNGSGSNKPSDSLCCSFTGRTHKSLFQNILLEQITCQFEFIEIWLSPYSLYILCVRCNLTWPYIFMYNSYNIMASLKASVDASDDEYEEEVVGVGCDFADFLLLLPLECCQCRVGQLLFTSSPSVPNLLQCVGMNIWTGFHDNMSLQCSSAWCLKQKPEPDQSPHLTVRLELLDLETQPNRRLKDKFFLFFPKFYFWFVLPNCFYLTSSCNFCCPTPSIKRLCSCNHGSKTVRSHSYNLNKTLPTATQHEARFKAALKENHRYKSVVHASHSSLTIMPV